MMNRIDKAFKGLKKSRRKAFIAFVTAGYPDLKTTEKLVLAFEAAGVSIIELGVPFSDPVADGPVIQAASYEALRRGVSLKKILGCVRRLRARTQIPMLAMTYFNPVLQYGLSRFIVDARSSGLDGVIIPDLPPEEETAFVRQAARSGLYAISFIAPTTSGPRARMILKKARGFLYYVALTGVTGVRRELPAELESQVRKVRRMAGSLPVCAGFGVSTRSQARSVASWCDGVIVGSAIVKKIAENLKRPDLVNRVSRFVASLI